MTSLRLLADDLTGALDSAAEFVPVTGPVMAFWRGSIPAALPANVALDSGTRELPAAEAAAIARDLVTHLAEGDIAFKKIDSLLRGPTVAELAAVMSAWPYCVLAPAFPFQGRITRGGRQFARSDGGEWVQAGEDLMAALRAQGVEVHTGRIDAGPEPGISVFDAETDEDLRRIVASVRRWPHPVLWSGTGGLAQALAAGAHSIAEPPVLAKPILGLFGSDHVATAAQLDACDQHHAVVAEPGAASIGAVSRKLAGAGVALVSFEIPTPTSRSMAAEDIAARIDRLTRMIEPPRTVVVAGGETLRSLCQSLGATGLLVTGRLVPGVPCSLMCGGRWDGVTVVSKSGAFGHPHLLRDLLPVTF